MTDTPVESNKDNSAAPVEAVQNLKDLLSADLKEVKALQNYESVDAMAKSLLNAQEMVGKRVKDLSADELKSLDAKFGVPETADGYKIEASDEFKAEALELGLNVNQAEKLLSARTKQAEGLTSIKEATMETFTKDLEDAFGGKLEANMDLAHKAALELGGEDLVSTLFKDGEPGDIKVIKALSEAGKRLFDHTSVQGGIQRTGSTPEEAMDKIASFKGSEEYQKGIIDRSPVVRMAVVNKLKDMYKIAYPK